MTGVTLPIAPGGESAQRIILSQPSEAQTAGVAIPNDLKEDLWKASRKKRAKIGAYTLLNKFEDPSITGLFIKNLKALEKEERSILFKLIRERKFNGSEFKAITQSFNTRHEMVRNYLVQLLTFFPEKRTLKFLNKIRRKEKSPVVLKSIDTLLEYIKNKI